MTVFAIWENVWKKRGKQFDPALDAYGEVFVFKDEDE
jgi:hypothetical protein